MGHSAEAYDESRMKNVGLERQQEETMKHDDEVRAGQNWKNCTTCGVDYLDECPKCNATTTYHVMVGIPDGPDDFEMVECECGCSEFWDKKEAISHAKSLVTNADQLVSVEDDEGREVYSNG